MIEAKQLKGLDIDFGDPCDDDLYPGIFPNNGAWPDFDFTHPFLDTAYYASRENMLDVEIGFDCRREKYMDAMQAATLGDSVSFKLEQLVHDYEIIVNDVTLPEINITKSLILKGEAYERLGKLDSASIEYERIVIHYPTSLDTMHARWRLLYIDAVQSDTTYGAVYDSTMRLYVDRVVKDLDFSYDTTGGGGGAKKAVFEDIEEQIENWNEEELAIKLDQNHPNPFASLTEIQYFVSRTEKVRLSLYDMTGKEISRLIDKYVRGGWHNIIVNGSGLSSGIYILRLESRNKAVVKKINKMD